MVQEDGGHMMSVRWRVEGEREEAQITGCPGLYGTA